MWDPPYFGSLSPFTVSKVVAEEKRTVLRDVLRGSSLVLLPILFLLPLVRVGTRIDFDWLLSDGFLTLSLETNMSIFLVVLLGWLDVLLGRFLTLPITR